MTETRPVGTQRPGGRTARTRVAVLDAVRDLLIEQSSASLRVELVAQRSGVHRSSIYRRWGDVAGIVADLADEISSNLPTPDTGALESDLMAMAQHAAERLSPDGAALIRALLAWPDPRVQAVLAGFWSRRREAVTRVLARHACPGDPAQVLRLLVGPLHYQAVIEGEAITADTAAHTVAAAARAARAPR